MVVESAQLGLSFIPDDVLRVMRKFREADFDIWLVGGALRDLLLDIAPKDWDLATSATPDQVMRLFPRVIPVGIRHGTVQVHTRTRDIEVTSFEPGGPEGILSDLARRDFTINSLALSYPDGVLIDPNGGRADLRDKLIRGVGNPRERFAEDPLRIVRAGRIAGLYGFALDPSTFEAMREESENIEKVSGERIRDEICKILVSPHPIEAFDLLRKGWALGKILPELIVRGHIDTAPGSGVSIYRHTLSCIVKCPERLRVRFAALFHEAGVPAVASRNGRLPIDFRQDSIYTATQRMKKWNMSTRWIEDVSALIENQLPLEAVDWEDAQIRRFLTRIRLDLIDDLFSLAEAEWPTDGSGQEGIRRLHARVREQIAATSAFRVSDLALSGNEIKEILDLPPGPQVGKVLRHLFDRVLENPSLNTREDLVRIVKNDFPRVE